MSDALSALAVVDVDTDQLEQLERATHYRNLVGHVSRIDQRTPCPVCRRTIRLHTVTHMFATYTRLHFRCGREVVERFDMLGAEPTCSHTEPPAT